jgi:soluble lytic murein transglycosylase-like protein
VADLAKALLPLLAEGGLDHRKLAAEAAADTAGIDQKLFWALVQAESGGRSDAVSRSGAVGPAQVTPIAAKAVGADPATLSDPVKNLNVGAAYLALMLDLFKDVPHAVAAYNAGPTAVRKFGGVPPFKETQRHVDRVLRLLATP